MALQARHFFFFFFICILCCALDVRYKKSALESDCLRLFFAHLKAGSDQRQILTSSRGNAARADQYTEQVLAKNQHYHPTEQGADSSEVPLNCNLSCQMYIEGCVDDNRNCVINDNCGRILCVLTNRLYVYSNYSVHKKGSSPF